MQDVKIYKQKDLVLKVNKYYNPQNLNLEEWELFLDVLCGEREYQKEAIKNAIIFMAGGEYDNIDDLITENYEQNVNIQSKYSRLSDYFRKLQIRNKFHANIDLATGTGKSYVIFGVSQIMLGLGIIKRVLVLCPSLTIEKGLTEKFINLAASEEIRNAIPESAIIKNPRIIDANETIREGDICVENIHAVYETTGSSIKDSFKNGGMDTLILNDESHHIYNNPQSINVRTKQGQNIKKWKEFLLREDYNFKYIMGFTGTAYIENEYFNDVIYRYSLREAIDDGVVKTINYVQKDEQSGEIYEKFQKIFHNHSINKNQHNSLKPLTIMVTKDINNAKNLYEELIDFLIGWEKIEREVAEKKVLIVTSASEHISNLIKLDYVDEKDNEIEWIISVSMLTEGWDVKNVFQIVPWEDRAFNSKLLIAQVLGRGLRIPEGYEGRQPSVTVFNHDNWSKNIRNLVDEVLEIETRIISSVNYEGERNKYNFVVKNISYEKQEAEVEHDEKSKPINYSKSWFEGIKLISQTDEIKKYTSYENVADGNIILKEYEIQYMTEDIDSIVNKVFHEFKMRDWEGGILGLGSDEIYSKQNLPPKNKVKEMIIRSMDKVGITGDRLTKTNAQRVYRTFSTLFRQKSKTIIQENKLNNSFEINTKDMNNESIGLSSLRRGSTIFYTTDYKNVAINEEQSEIFDAFLQDGNFTRNSSNEINPYFFKTPQNYVFTNEKPEFEFVKKLCDKNISKKIESWIKSRDKGFYSIEYSYRISNHQRQRNFNPDFFIKYVLEDEIVFLVVEIKGDGDVSIENKAKYKYGKKHFEDLNKKLLEEGMKERYIFHFLSPKDYHVFFKFIDEGKMFDKEKEFRGELESLLEKNGDI